MPKKPLTMPKMGSVSDTPKNEERPYDEIVKRREQKAATKRACVMLTADQYRALKYLSIDEERTITSFVREFVDMGLRKYEKKGN